MEHENHRPETIAVCNFMSGRGIDQGESGSFSVRLDAGGAPATAPGITCAGMLALHLDASHVGKRRPFAEGHLQ